MSRLVNDPKQTGLQRMLLLLVTVGAGIATNLAGAAAAVPYILMAVVFVVTSLLLARWNARERGEV